MAFKVFTLLINGLVPVIPAWFIMNSHPETAVIKPWPIVWTLLGVNVLFILDRLETPRIYTPATRNGSLDVNHQCIRPFGNVQLAVSCRNAVFVSRANSAVLFHAGCMDCLD